MVHVERAPHEVHSITDAPQKHSEEQHGRMVRYTVSMGIRLVCFILAGVTAVVWETWWSMAFIAAAVVLPYVAVVDANAGGDRYVNKRTAEDLSETPPLLSAHALEDEHADEPSGNNESDIDDPENSTSATTVIPGTIIEEDEPETPPEDATPDASTPEETRPEGKDYSNLRYWK